MKNFHKTMIFCVTYMSAVITSILILSGQEISQLSTSLILSLSVFLTLFIFEIVWYAKGLDRD